MNRDLVPVFGYMLNELLREEKRLLTQSTMDHQQSTHAPVTYAAKVQPRNRDLSVVQYFCCKKFGHYASNCVHKLLQKRSAHS